MPAVKVSITVRDPGDHHEVWTGELPFIPREGEYIVLPGESAAQTVAQVVYDMNDATVYLYVDPL